MPSQLNFAPQRSDFCKWKQCQTSPQRAVCWGSLFKKQKVKSVRLGEMAATLTCTCVFNPTLVIYVMNEGAEGYRELGQRVRCDTLEIE